MSTPIYDPRGYDPFGVKRSQVIDRGRDFSQVIDRGPAFSQVIDRGPQFSQVIDRGPAFGQGYSFGDAGVGVRPMGQNVLNQTPTPDDFPAPPWDNNGGAYPFPPDPGPVPGGGPTPVTPPAPGAGATAPTPAAGNSFEDWYKNTIQAHPEKYDTGISKEQWQAWFPLWTGSGFKSSKVDVNGNPIQGVFDDPDDCPPGMAAYGQNACAPQGYGGGGGGAGAGGAGAGGGGVAGSGYTFGAPPNFNLPPAPIFNAPTGANEQNDPGYAFRLSQGEGALAASAAAKGTLNTGGTLQDTLKYGQEYASGEFDKVWNRAKDQFAPKLAEWQMQFNAAKEQGMAQYQRLWEEYTFSNLSAAQKEQIKVQMAQIQAQIDAMDLAATNAAGI